jgi:hypothetical protein
MQLLHQVAQKSKMTSFSFIDENRTGLFCPKTFITSSCIFPPTGIEAMSCAMTALVAIMKYSKMERFIFYLGFC